MKRFPLIFTLIILAIGCIAHAATYCVAPGGNDNAAGTAAAPFKTIQKGVSVLKPDDALDVKAGSFGGFTVGSDAGVYAPINGTSGHPITIQGEPGAIINGRNDKTMDNVDLEGCSWIVMQGFTVTGSLRDGIRVAPLLNSKQVVSTISDHVTIQNNTVDGSARFGIDPSWTSNVLVQNNTVSNSKGDSSTTGHGIYIANTTVNPIVRGNIIFGNSTQGIHINGDKSGGGAGTVTNALIEGNIVYGNGANSLNCDGMVNSIVQGNLFYNLDDGHNGISLYQIDAKTGSTGNLIQNNTIIAQDTAIQLGAKGANNGNTIKNNVLVGSSFITVNNGSTSPIDSGNIKGTTALFVGATATPPNFHLSVGDTAGYYTGTVTTQPASVTHAFQLPGLISNVVINADKHSVTVTYTVDGTVVNMPDTNLDGIVDFNDLVNVSHAFNQTIK